MSRLRAIAALVTVIVAAGSAGYVLHRLGSISWLRVEPSLEWLRTTPPGDAIPALLRTAGMWCALWVALGTGIHLAAILAGLGRAIDLSGVLVLPAVRRIGRVALAGALSWPAVPAPAVSPPPLVEPAPGPVEDEILDASWPATVRRPEASPTERPTTSAATRASAVVRPGDNLWRIARRVLVEAGLEHPTSREVATYWLTVIEVNRYRLRSGDPHLIYPGEEILLPSPADVVNQEGS